MARAGWCRECGEWVWVDEEGSCQYGHESDCVDHVHEQHEDDLSQRPEGDPGQPQGDASNQPQTAIAERPFGVGDLPQELNRFNWGAFFLPLFWGFAYGSWPIVMVWLLALISPIFIGGLAGTGQSTPAATIVAVTVIAEMISGVARLWAGVNANRLLWVRESARLQFVEDVRPRFTVEKFAGRQRTWTIVSSILIVTGMVFAMPFEAQAWKPYELTYVGAIMPVVWLFVEVALGAWLDSRARTGEGDQPL